MKPAGSLTEGIRGKSATGSVLTLSYRLLRRNRRPGLVVRNPDLDALPHLSNPPAARADGKLAGGLTG